MKQTTDKPRKGFTMVPNVLIDNPALSVREKIVLITYLRHAYGEKTDVYPSHAGIARRHRMKRDSVKSVSDELTKLGIIEPLGKGRQGKQETYRLHLDRLENMPYRGPCNMPAGGTTPALSGDIKHTAEENELKNTLTDSVTLATEAPFERGGIHGKTTLGKCSANEEPALSGTRLTKREINEQMLTPSGNRPDVDGLDSDLNCIS